MYDFFRRWRRHGYIRELHQRLRRTERVRQGREPEPSAGIIDSQSVDGSETCPTASRGYDGGKSRDGRKRHILTDSGAIVKTCGSRRSCCGWAWRRDPSGLEISSAATSDRLKIAAWTGSR